jgi:tetratricopeptide (TPR) repeat protein
LGSISCIFAIERHQGPGFPVMSNKKRKIKKKHPRAVKPRQLISSQQNSQLQQAIQAQSTGNQAFAESIYRTLIAEKVRTPELYCSLASICAQTTRRGEADILWKKALAIAPRFLEAQMNLADSYQQAGNIEQAINSYRRIITDHGQLVVAKNLLAKLLKYQGKFSEAADYYQQVMAQQPDYTQAHFSYSGIHKYQDKTDPHISLMLELYQKPNLKTENRIHLAFALAKAFEDTKDYAQAFKYLKTGNDFRNKEFNYQIESDKDLIQSIIKSFSREAISQVQVIPETSNKPIFIVGMPRSGTSLVEKIISSHSDVYAAGELEYIFALGTRLFLKESFHYQFGPLNTYSKSAFELLGKSYLEKIELLDSKTSRLTDKMPFNMMMIGLIKIALPRAKIIHCVREAKDNCLSIYKQNFTTGNYRFAYDLKTVGQFHNQYQMLMKHWHQVMPGAIYDISYEALTHKPEVEIRKLLSACDLDWQDNCLNFDKSAGIVKTASAFQARQPMYTSSVKLWEKYGELLQPLLDELN